MKTTDEVELLSEYHWRDVNQFHNSMGSGYENLTNWTMNSTGRLHLVIDFNCFFDYQDNLTGYANISILEDGELVWSNVTSEKASFSFNYCWKKILVSSFGFVPLVRILIPITILRIGLLLKHTPIC